MKSPERQLLACSCRNTIYTLLKPLHSFSLSSSFFFFILFLYFFSAIFFPQFSVYVLPSVHSPSLCIGFFFVRCPSRAASIEEAVNERKATGSMTSIAFDDILLGVLMLLSSDGVTTGLAERKKRETKRSGGSKEGIVAAGPSFRVSSRCLWTRTEHALVD